MTRKRKSDKPDLIKIKALFYKRFYKMDEITVYKVIEKYLQTTYLTRNDTNNIEKTLKNKQGKKNIIQLENRRHEQTFHQRG